GEKREIQGWRMAMRSEFAIGPNIRRLRKQRSLSLTALAKRAGVSKAYLSQLENDPKKRPSVEIVIHLSKALGVPLTQVIGIDESFDSEDSQRGLQQEAPLDTQPRIVEENLVDPDELPAGLRILWAECP